MEWEIVFYTDAEGASPVREYLRSLNPHQRREVGRTIEYLEDSGINLRKPHAKSLGGGLWELRTQVEGDAFRCLYFAWTKRRFVLLHAFQKKRQKTPKAEIDTALRHRADWLSRNKEER